MGLDYSYNIICRREQLWDVLDEAAKWSSRDFRDYDATFELDDRDINRPLRDVWKQDLILEETPIRDISTDTSLWFEYDAAIRNWEKTDEYDEGENGGRYIGSIYVYIYPFLEYEYGDENTLLDCDDVEISFTAATTCMSRLFEKSVSIRKTFIEIAKAHDGAICVLDREGNDIVVWFESEDVWVEVGDSNTSREVLTRQIQENRIYRVLKEQTRKMTDRQVFLQAIKSDDAMMRAAAISLLGKKNPVLFKTLREMLFNDADAEVRRRCAIALAQKLDRETQSVWLQALNDESALVRSEICRLIDKTSLGNQLDVTGALVPLLKDSSRNVRRSAMWAFCKLARAEHIPQLIEVT